MKCIECGGDPLHLPTCTQYLGEPTGVDNDPPADRRKAGPSVGEIPIIVRNERDKIFEAMAELNRRKEVVQIAEPPAPKKLDPFMDEPKKK